MRGGLVMVMAPVQSAQAPQRSVQLPRLRPPHPTWDGEAAPTTQAQVTTVVVDTTGAELSGLGRPTMAVTHPPRGAGGGAATTTLISEIFTTPGTIRRTTSNRTGQTKRKNITFRRS